MFKTVTHVFAVLALRSHRFNEIINMYGLSVILCVKIIDLRNGKHERKLFRNNSVVMVVELGVFCVKIVFAV